MVCWTKSSRSISILLGCLSFSLLAFGQEDSKIVPEIGLLPTLNFAPEDYKQPAQNWAIVQDKRGIIYVANNGGSILEYDGERWRSILTINEDPVRSLAAADNGWIYVGSVGEIGVIRPDSIGQMTYYSLMHLLEDDDQRFGNVTRAFATPEGIYFQTRHKIFLLAENSIQTWEPEFEESSFNRAFYLDALYILQTGYGLTKLADGNIKEVPGGDLFADDIILGILPLDAESALIVSEDGFHKMLLESEDQNEKITAFDIKEEDYFLRNRIYNAISLDQDYFSVGFWDQGIGIVNKSGQLSRILTKGAGLRNEIIQNQFVDREDNLWLALGNGIAKAEYNSPVSYFGALSGLGGSAQSIIRHKEKLYVATTTGLYYTSGFKIGKKIDPVAYTLSRFEKIKDLGSSEGFDLLSLRIDNKEILLGAFLQGVYQINDDNSATMISSSAPWTLHQSSKNPNRVYVGLEPGMVSIYWKNGQWIEEGPIEGIDEVIHNISEDAEGNLWLGTLNQNILKLSVEAHNDEIVGVSISRYDRKKGLPEGDAWISTHAGKPLAATFAGLYQYVSSKDAFEPFTLLGDKFVDSNRVIHRLSEDSRGNLWMVTIPNDEVEIGFVNEANPTQWESATFSRVAMEIIHSIYHEENGISWLGGDAGLYRYDSHIEKNYLQQYKTLLRKVTLGEDSILFGGTYFDENKGVSMKQRDYFLHTLPYANNSMSFEFAAQSSDQDGNFYKWYLEGFDKEWTDWKQLSHTGYTNLPEGHYYFHVKALNIFGKESLEAVYEFSILPPWSRTIIAYIGYLLFFIGFVYGAVIISNRGLRNIIRERTTEIREQRDVIELKNKDITDSINYAQRIQAAILPKHKEIQEVLPESFILFKPKDIVSGDFYWSTQKDGHMLVAAADCTGHGVPGAFMSMIGNSLLNEIVNDRGIVKPSEVLQVLKNGVINSLKQTGEEGESKDGMDIALLTFDMANKKLSFAGAYNSLYTIRDDELSETRADRMPIGIYSYGTEHFTNHEMDIKSGDVFYIFSDGYADQFGGPKGKKFMYKTFKQMLLDIHKKDMEEQKQILNDRIEQWRGPLDQIDDIVIIGIRV